MTWEPEPEPEGPVWPEPREDPDEEKSEPWARKVAEQLDRWRGWDDHDADT